MPAAKRRPAKVSRCYLDFERVPNMAMIGALKEMDHA